MHTAASSTYAGPSEAFLAEAVAADSATKGGKQAHGKLGKIEGHASRCVMLTHSSRCVMLTDVSRCVMLTDASRCIMQD